MNHLLETKRGSLLASLATQNMTLKICISCVSAIVIIETIALIFLGFKKPIIVSIQDNQPSILASQVDTDQITIPEYRAFIVELLSRKFTKTPNIDIQKSVCRYFTAGLKAACEKEISEHKLLVPQDYIIQEMSWDERSESSKILIKRFATFNGLVSAIMSRITVKLQKRERSIENPWGIFVKEWREEVQK